MTNDQITALYSSLPQTSAVAKTLKNEKTRTLFLEGLLASSAAMFFASLSDRVHVPFLFILQDNDEAGYFYNDLRHLLSKESQVLFLPSSYRRAVKYGQRDAANEILRTEVLSALSSSQLYNNKEGENASESGTKQSEALPNPIVVTCPEALSELVVSKKVFNDNAITLVEGESQDLILLQRKLR